MSPPRQDPLPPVYRIGADGRYALRRDTHELLHGGRPVDVQPKVFDLIAFLVDNRHRAVDKNELQDAIWPRQVVTETALTRAIMKARRAFGDDADAQRVIRTVHSRGYQFVAPVLVLDKVAEPDLPADVAPETLESPEDEEPTIGTMRRHALLRVAAIVVLLAFAWFGYSRRVADPDPVADGAARVAVLPVENVTGSSRHDWARLGLMSAIHEVLRDGHAVTVLAARDVMRLAEREREPAALAATLRQALGATHVLSTRLELEGSTLRVTYALRDPEDRVRQGTLGGDDVAALARGVAADLGVILGRAARRSPATTDPLANEAWLRGRALSLQGDLKGAQELFRLAREQAPDAFWPAYEYALTVRDLGGPDEAQALLELLLVQARRAADPRAELAASNALAILLLRRDRNDEAERLVRAGLAIAEPRDQPHELGPLLSTLAIAQRERGDLDGARASMLRVLEIDTRHGMPSAGPTYNGLAQIELRLGDWSGTEQHLRQAIDAFRLIGDERNASYPLNGLANLRLRQGRYGDGRELAQEALAVRRAAGDRRGEAISLVMLAEIERAAGRLGDALARATDAADLGAALGDGALLADALSVRVPILRERGELDSARAQAQEALAQREATGDRAGALALRIELARIEALHGDRGAARRALETVLADGHPSEAASDAELELARLAQADGNADAANAHYERALALATERSSARAAAQARLGLAEVALARGDVGTARARIADVGDALPEDPARWRAQAALAAADGNAVQAVEHERTAKRLAGERWTAADEARLAERESAAPAPAG